MRERHRRQGERLLTDDLVGRNELPNEPDDLRRDLDVAEAEVRVPERPFVNLVDDHDVGCVARLGVEVRVGFLDEGNPRHQVELLHQVLLALMEIDGARVERAEGAVLVARADELAGVGKHYAIDVPAAGPDVDVAMRRRCAHVVPAIGAAAKEPVFPESLERGRRVRAEEFGRPRRR